MGLQEIPDSALFQLALYARGLLRSARGELAAAQADLLLCGEREVALGGLTPAAMAWRSHAALLCRPAPGMPTARGNLPPTRCRWRGRSARLEHWVWRCAPLG